MTPIFKPLPLQFERFSFQSFSFHPMLTLNESPVPIRDRMPGWPRISPPPLTRRWRRIRTSGSKMRLRFTKKLFVRKEIIYKTYS